VSLNEPSFSEVDIPLEEAQCLVIDLVLVPQMNDRLAFNLQCLSSQMIKMGGGKLRRIRFGLELIAIFQLREALAILFSQSENASNTLTLLTRIFCQPIHVG
jgi:hypothetical protein